MTVTLEINMDEPTLLTAINQFFLKYCSVMINLTQNMILRKLLTC